MAAFQHWTLYPLWMAAFDALGYDARPHILMASDYGVPQRRKRLFVVASRVGATIEPRATTIEPPFGPHINWDEGDWRDTAAVSPSVAGRFSKGRANHGPRFLSQHVTGHPGVGLHEPIRTITTKDQWVVVDGDRYRPLTVREYARAMSFPDTYAWPESATRTDSIKGLGNAVCPIQAEQIIKEVT